MLGSLQIAKKHATLQHTQYSERKRWWAKHQKGMFSKKLNLDDFRVNVYISVDLSRKFINFYLRLWIEWLSKFVVLLH